MPEELEIGAIGTTGNHGRLEFSTEVSWENLNTPSD